MYSPLHDINHLINLFKATFLDSFNTQLVKGNDEPIYLPAGQSDIGIPAKPYAQVVFAHGYFTSALHEIAHWCIAGEERRQKIDFGYWYCPDGRTAQQQNEFQKVEIKPQAIEWAFSVAAGIKFNVSCDNLSGDELGNQPDHNAFQAQVFEQVSHYLQHGFPTRANMFITALAKYYGNSVPTLLTQFEYSPAKKVA